uniref:GRIP domain-containing protein n=1 Tax=Pseudo-nitzschia australis TaxID=44445 RepID=A0A6U9VV19_9STRA|mmetsp:Transcript_18480/g.40234  ORF Transcript_18480/g.40234 Transcript_18480/m.40234 type:complete len:503 (+) Transcript_18480:430-1938(+)|eukprot:CAMPEP_0168163868 /NCGR_PEP_ID=MMETSP0139_2-20121125/616_1 /TAXON_ID=44445 /ORGANISM="Pseudo-nitzschia australis, Strain 10249 10 AB" /LENGTH=502 /DNA_ID=CAMNT_0008080813 /DNA_START=381 /DNA_END=1889 /DNA_ORIENTATION=-
MAGISNGNRDTSPKKTSSGNGNANGDRTGGSGRATNASANANVSARAVQMQKMKDANNKYKNLLKMAKERIERQEIELKELKDTEKKRAEEEIASRDSGDNNAKYLDDANINDDLNNGYWNLARISQLIRVDLEASELNARGLKEETWALCHWEREETDDQRFLINDNNKCDDIDNKKKQWKCFDSESDLRDFIRRDTGEPLILPSYSHTPQQSSRTINEADKRVSVITEEYRRFRVKSEMTRKQMDAHIRDLQSSQVEVAKRNIEGREYAEQKLEATQRTEHSQLERMRAEAARQEDQWKESYDILLKENEALKSSGSEAMLASQWRQRYEACLKERDEAVSKVELAQQRHEHHKQQHQSSSLSSPLNTRGGKNSKGNSSEGKYEMKYRDLKESFRLYRKKAKEIFESQAAAAATNNSAGGKKSSADMMVLQMSQQNSNAEEDSKLSYLKNLMVNYLTAEPEVRDHMEVAIGTVLKFTSTDVAAITKKKEEDASWGAYIGY